MTQARIHLTRALGDVENLLNFHQQIGGVAQGRRAISLSSLNKSGIVLLCAAWETYVESVVRERAGRLIRRSLNPSALPKPIHRLVTSHVRSDKNEAVWVGLAGTGWKDVARAVVEERTRALNTPKPGPVRELFRAVLGVPDITDDWAWARNPQARVIQRLTEFVTLRGAIAHGEQLPNTVKKSHLNYNVDLVLRLADKIEERVRAIR